jgi:hypothetical protein
MRPLDLQPIGGELAINKDREHRRDEIHEFLKPSSYEAT